MQSKRSYLRLVRKQRNLSIASLAQELGVDPSHMAGIERGRRDPSLKLACQLEKFFNIPVCELLRRDDDED